MRPSGRGPGLERFGERLQSAGVTSGGYLAEACANPESGTWTWVLTPAGRPDLHFVARWRRGAEEVGRWIRRGVVLAFLSGLVRVVGQGLKIALK